MRHLKTFFITLLAAILVSGTAHAALFIRDKGSQGKYGFWDRYGTQHDLETPIRSGNPGNWQTAIYDPNTRQTVDQGNFSNVNFDQPISVEHVYNYTHTSISVVSTTDWIDNSAVSHRTVLEHQKSFTNGVPHDFSIQVSNLKGDKNLGFSWQLYVKGSLDADYANITENIQGIPRYMIYGVKRSGGLIFDAETDFGGHYSGDLSSIKLQATFDGGSFDKIGWGNNRVFQPKSSSGVDTTANYRTEENIYYDAVNNELVALPSAYASFSSGRISASGTTLTLEKVDELFYSSLPSAAKGFYMGVDMAAASARALEDALLNAQDVGDIMRFYVQFDAGGYLEYLPDLEYTYHFLDDSLIIYADISDLSGGLDHGNYRPYDYKLDIYDYSDYFADTSALSIFGGGGGDPVSPSPSVPEIPAAALPFLMIGLSVIVLKLRSSCSTRNA